MRSPYTNHDVTIVNGKIHLANDWVTIHGRHVLIGGGVYTPQPKGDVKLVDLHAKAATLKARRTGKATDHKKAAELHTASSKIHRAISDQLQFAGQTHEAESHSDLARQHEISSQQHYDDYSNSVNKLKKR